jgi:hypothetical protein
MEDDVAAMLSLRARVEVVSGAEIAQALSSAL